MRFELKIVSVGLCAMAIVMAGLIGWAGGQDVPADSTPAPRRVKVLFLGDNGHHVPLERCRDVYSVMGIRGIDFTYTDDLNDLNPDTLGRYDVLLLYANWTQIGKAQEKALLDFVEAGHGLAAIHCASYCFLNSPKITTMIGGRFKSHNTGTFKETIVAPDHLIEKGLKPIESWDETYVHEMHNEKDRQVLSYRVEGSHREPYTWTRTQGRGRVFYTAWGHDQRTWTNADFQNLLERGIRWAAGDWALAPQPALKPFSYVKAEVPNYIPNARWGTTGTPFSQMQEPLSPSESMKHVALPPGFELKLFTSEPQVKKPICMAFDERGRLWVAETFDYPNNMQRPGQGHDQITICEDTRGDGVADKFTVFADKLSIPTSIVFANGGVIVSQAPDMLFLKDTQGTGHADLRKVLFHGFGTRDTHAGPSNLRWGFDNWIYGTCGYSGFDGEVNGERVRFGEGVFRFKPDGSRLEFLGTTTNNTWGLGISENNQIFGSTANGDPAWYLHIPNRYYETLAGWPATRLESIADSWHFWPVTDQIRQVDWWGGYTAGAGSALYTARTFPRFYWNRVAFVSEPTGHIVGQFILEPRGSDFISRNDFNLLASDDGWAAPIAADVGPDGQLWVIDWYNYIIQHNPIPRGWQSGKGGAYETPLRDKRHGRIYRVLWTAGKPSETFNLTAASSDTLIRALHSDNMLWRMHAQRLLVERGDKSVIPALMKLAEDRSIDQIGLNPTAIHALWTIHGLGGFDGPDAQASAAAVEALGHPSAGVRKAAADVLPRTESSVAAILAHKMLEDPDPQVRKSTLLALSEMPSLLAAGTAIDAMLARPENSKDRWIPDAIAIAAARHAEGFLQAAFDAHPARPGPASQPVEVANLIPNPSFEDCDLTRAFAPLEWKVRDYSGRASHGVDQPGHTGSRCLRIASDSGADASAYVDVMVIPNTQYRLSAWIKTDRLNPVGGVGALLNVHELQSPRVATPVISGTSAWQRVSVDFNSGNHTHLSINCLFGGWGQARGVAWFDDVSLVKSTGNGAVAGVEQKIIDSVVRQYARRGPVDSVIATLQSARRADASLAAVVIDALAAAWPQGVAPKLLPDDIQQLHQVMDAASPQARDAILALALRWGRQDLFAAESAREMDSLRATIANSSLDSRARVEAARRLVTIDSSPAAAEFVLRQISPTQPPDVQVGLLAALGQSRDGSLGAALVGQYSLLAPAAQRAAMTLLIRRTIWTPALLDGIQSGKIDNRDLLPQQWDALKNNPDDRLARRAGDLQKKTGHAPTADRKEIVDKFLPVADMRGDPARGKLVFEQNCIVCHTLDGRGGNVGPELTGVGAKPPTELLHKVLDPNSSVEGTFRQWVVRTKTGDVIAGRIFAENRASIELIDATAKLHEIQREDIDRLVPTPKTLMPEGFEQLGKDKLADLLAYLATSKVKR